MLKTAEFINAGEAIVVYRNKRDHEKKPLAANESPGNKSLALPDGVERIIRKGPLRYVPEPDEWLHEFTWHGSDKAKTKKIYGALQFTKLRIIADQTYYNVRAF